ncbi:hypothetical protein [Brucella abortus]|uniref:hypothetical protein n=1 Tax=Brucella abortus TaxID=235 RepID=UPI003013CC60
MKGAVNPFAGDKDREQIWEMFVRLDIEAFIAQDWSMVADDFDEARFLGIHAHNNPDPDKWDAGFPPRLPAIATNGCARLRKVRLSNMPSLWLKAFSGQRI